jgi:hypothetical protein
MTTKILTNQFQNQLLEVFPLLFQLLKPPVMQMTLSGPILLAVIHSERVLILLLLILIRLAAGKINHLLFITSFIMFLSSFFFFSVLLEIHSVLQTLSEESPQQVVPSRRTGTTAIYSISENSL